MDQSKEALSNATKNAIKRGGCRILTVILLFISAFILSNMVLSYTFIYWPFAEEVDYRWLGYILVQIFIAIITAVITTIGSLIIIWYYGRAGKVPKAAKIAFGTFSIITLVIFIVVLTQRFNPENYAAPEFGGLIFAYLLGLFLLFFLPIFLSCLWLTILSIKLESVFEFFRQKGPFPPVVLLLLLLISFGPFFYLTYELNHSERLHQEGIEKLNPVFCDRIDLSLERDKCLFDVFFNTKNSSLCTEIKDYGYFVKCVSNSVYFTQSYENCKLYDTRVDFYSSGDKKYCYELLTDSRLLAMYGYNETSFTDSSGSGQNEVPCNYEGYVCLTTTHPLLTAGQRGVWKCDADDKGDRKEILVGFCEADTTCIFKNSDRPASSLDEISCYTLRGDNRGRRTSVKALGTLT